MMLRLPCFVLSVLICATALAQEPPVGSRPQTPPQSEEPAPPKDPNQPPVAEISEPAVEPTPTAPEAPKVATPSAPAKTPVTPETAPSNPTANTVTEPSILLVPVAAAVEEETEKVADIPEPLPVEEVPPMLARIPENSNPGQVTPLPIVVEPIVKIVEIDRQDRETVEPAFGFYDLIPGLGDRDGSPLPILALFLVSLIAALCLRAIRDRLPHRGIIPQALAMTHTMMRIIAVVLGFAASARLIPIHLAPALIWTLIAAAIALGWSSRDVLADLLGYVVILFERKLRPGTWVEAKGFEGTVESVGPRATWVLDHHGNRVGIPNHQLVKEAVLTDPLGDREQEVSVMIKSDVPSNIVRQALRDAVLSSPWVHPGSSMLLLRHTSTPKLWRVRARMLEASHSARFEGELLERAEENIERLTTKADASALYDLDLADISSSSLTLQSEIPK